MNRHLKTGFLSAAIAVVSGVAGGAGLPPGDGLGPINSYAPARKSVVIGKQEVALTPQAAASLEQQLTLLALPPGKPFGARFNVVLDASRGGAVIESIYVFPPRRR